MPSLAEDSVNDALFRTGFKILRAHRAILLFFEEFGPVLLVWFAILGAPVWVLWRYYRRVISRI